MISPEVAVHLACACPSCLPAEIAETARTVSRRPLQLRHRDDSPYHPKAAIDLGSIGAVLRIRWPGGSMLIERHYAEDLSPGPVES